jgi:hypothetical protein
VSPSPNAVELTVEQAWFIADQIGVGTFPWVLAITPPYRDAREGPLFDSVQRGALTGLDLLTADGTANADVADWIRAVCHCDQWLELRYIGHNTRSVDLMRGIIARRAGRTVVALRSGQLVTITAMTVDHPHSLVPIAVAGLAGRQAAAFPEFALPARVGARADQQLRSGAKIAELMDFLGVPIGARPVVASVYAGPRSYVEIVAGERCDGRYVTSEVGLGIVDSTAGRILVSADRALDGEWVSTFAPGTQLAIAVAIERLTATLPQGRWFPQARVTREFITQTS